MPLATRDGRDVQRSDVIWLCNFQVTQQAGVDLVSWISKKRARLSVDVVKSHFAGERATRRQLIENRMAFRR